MSKSLFTLRTYVQRQCRIDPADVVANDGIQEDLNDGIGIVAAQRNWDELYATLFVNLLATDGDKVYPVVPQVDKIEQVRITVPITYARPLDYIPRKQLLTYVPAKTNSGTGTPSRWYYAEPAFDVNGLETKNMSFDTMPDQSYTVAYTFRTYPIKLVNTNDVPFFDGNFHYILGDFAAWKYATRNPDVTLNPDAFERKWKEGLALLLDGYASKVVDNAPIPGPSIRQVL